MTQEVPAQRIRWADHREQLAIDAKTMTNLQLAEKFGVNRYSMRKALERLGIEPKPSIINWSEKLEELKFLAKTMTYKELAAHFGVTPMGIYATCQNYKVTPQPPKRPERFFGRLAELKEKAPTMSATELAEHFGASLQAVRDNLKALKIECAPDKRFIWDQRTEEIKRLVAAGNTYEQLAGRYGCKVSTLRNAVWRMGLSVKRQPKSEAKQRPAPAATQEKVQPVFNRRAAPAAGAASIKAAQIVMPENVKFISAPFNPPPDCRICNGSSTDAYKPSIHGGATTSYRR